MIGKLIAEGSDAYEAKQDKREDGYFTESYSGRGKTLNRKLTNRAGIMCRMAMVFVVYMRDGGNGSHHT